MKRRSSCSVILFASLAASAWGQTTAAPGWVSVVSRNVFEVVLQKPDIDPFVYQERLPLELIPYSQRVDTKYSIGTSFAIGNGLFVSAAHVFSLESQTLREPLALRDSAGKVYPVGNVVAYSSRRDYVVFEVPGLDAAGLSLSRDFTLNAKVYAAGNALGEGVVIRDGLLTSVTPEDRNGDWNWLRFSAAASPGNSGGPLLDENGHAIGIVMRKSQNENLNYALPVSEMDLRPVAIEDVRNSYHLPNVTHDAPIEGATSLVLPMPVGALRQKIHDFYSDLIFTAANSIAKKPSALFPQAQGSEASLGTGSSSVFPRFVVQQPDGTWQIQGVEKTATSRVGEEGSLQYGSLWRYTIFSLSKPHEVTLAALFEHPHSLMDTVLQGFPFYRKVSTREIRISSFGEPTTVDHFEDSYGRRWLMARWDIPFADLSEILLALPTPNGAVGMMVQCSYDEWPASEFDIRFLADYLVLSYSASLKEWEEFFASPELRPRLLDSVQFSYAPGSALFWDTPRLGLTSTPSLIGISDQSRMILSTAYYREDGKGRWDISSLAVSESETAKTYITIGKVVRPARFASDQIKQTWAALSSDGYPFDGNSYQANGATSILHARHPTLDGKTIADPDFLYVTILSIEGSIRASDAERRFNILKNGFYLKPPEEASAQSGPQTSPSVQELALQNGKTIFQAIATADEAALNAFIGAHSDLEALNEDHRTPLLLALRLGNPRITADLLSAGVHLDGVDRFGNTPLLLALRYASPTAARDLIEKGTDMSKPDPDGFTPLMIAMGTKFEDLPELLVNRGIDVKAVSSRNTSVLTFALLNGRGALAAEIVRRGASMNVTDNNGWTILMYALRYSDAATAQFLIDRGCPLDGKTDDGWTPLFFAARYSTAATTMLLLRSGAVDIDTPNKTGQTPLMMALEYGQPDEVRALLDKGANPKARDDQGWTPLSYALRYGDEARVQAVMKSLVTMPDPDKKGWTALHFTARYMPQLIASVAKLGGVSMNARNSGGWTPLHMATENGSLAAVQWLVLNGADPSLKNDDGRTALDLAHAERKADIEAYLRGLSAQGGQDKTPAPTLTLSETGVNLFTGDTFQITATAPATGAIQTVTWKTSDPHVAVVSSSGRIDAVAVGVATITAATDGGLSTTCTIGVWGPDGKGYVQFKTDDPSSRGGWDKSFPGDASWAPSGNPIAVYVDKESGLGGQGFGFRYCYQNERNFYEILVDTLGEFTVRKCEGGTRTTLLPWSANSGLRKGFGQANKISVVRPSRNFYVIAFNDNASSQVAYSDSSFTEGFVMFYATVGAQENFPSVPEDERFKIALPVAYP